MLLLATLITLLSIAEASLKTPRTALTPCAGGPTASLLAATPLATPPAAISGVLPFLPNGTRHHFPPYPTAASASGGHRSFGHHGTASHILPTGTRGGEGLRHPHPAKAPTITPSPELPGGNFHELGGGANVKFVQTTYWSCVTWPSETHCGWHEPILDASNAARGVSDSGRAALWAGVVVVVVVVAGVVLGM
ncbi:uncharacterized protein GGS25DRAFT_523950 [Hypoxylon fragiforme]|uniref:uncharacterized protein n=1 Tax=Hypoxylon fragiforme TaxID=63214 RepID=UPI0020C637EC|nr:uncharacterized protein GGS25DRAFT_523950 [Hypoxylon fragiforme]KAI2606284.1 hypothetical protein GGS25DRAFT_523950 [Hypoxylon fragiforme]